MKSIFNKNDIDELVYRVYKLNIHSKKQWGKMDVIQMLAHCNRHFQIIYSEKAIQYPNIFKITVFRLVFKRSITSDRPFKKNCRTMPESITYEMKDIEIEKRRLVDYLYHTQQLGNSYFEGRISFTLGTLTSKEWSNMIYKHLDYHLRQFNM